MPNNNLNTLLVIPVYNHTATLGIVVRRAIAAGWQVLVVDDGSTEDVIEPLAGLNCQLLMIPENQGKGAAILAGATVADEQGYDAIVTVDADGQHDPAHALALLRKTRDTWPVLVIGNRRMDASTPRSSRFGRAFSNFWVHLETGLSLPDTQSGMRLYPVRELLRLETSCRGYDFEIEILVRAAWAGIPICSVEVPVYYPPTEKRISHFDKRRDNLRLTRLHTRLILRALAPGAHKKLVAPKEKPKQAGLLLHPIRFFRLLLREHTTPIMIAAAIWLGIFLGTLPLIACHTVAIIYVAHKLHLNKVIAVAASQLCMPPLVPALCIEVGYFLRHGHFLTELSLQTLVKELHLRLLDYLLGSLIVGPLLGIMVAGPIYALLLWRKRSPKTAQAK